ncbi:MAG: class I adenylate-forming enzyme family protein [Acidimicrobiales bacterium]|nr:class I adenylate-forming enzyme family protein [Acidimicrobiales bacterium]MDG2218063.1 class I adenylate-forming enzyme family protein [Acidimicrobiales bacterium]
MNIMMLLEMAASGLSDRVAIGSLADGLTYQQLFDRSGSAAAHFKAEDAEHVVLCDESSAAVPIALFGSAWAGLPYVPLNYRLPDDDLRALAERTDPAVAIADHSGVERLAPVTGIDTVERHSFLDASASGATLADPWSMDADDIAVLLFTSGTTGAPKSAVLRHKHLVSYILNSVEFMGAGEDEATIVSVPPYHIAGVASMLSSIYAGRRIVQLPKFDPHVWIDTVEAEGVTHAMVVPTMLARIVEALDERGGEPLLGVRALSYGGGKMPTPVIRRALDLFPITNFVNAYGLTETSSTIALLGPDDHRVAQYSDNPAEQQRLASVGKVLPGVEISIRDDDGNNLAAGEVGEIFVSGEQVSGEYLEKGSLLVDGWFPTRDGGFIDADGYLFVQGRNDDVIIRGGENISPGEIEDLVLSLDGIRDAAAIGVPCSEWGEKVVLVLVSADGSPSEADIQEVVRSRLRSSRVPAHVEYIDELPYNETGKLLRRVLRTDFAHRGDDPTD